MKHVLAYLVFVASVSVAHAQAFDTVILNGRVIDPETGLDGIRSVGIIGDKITAISEFQLDGATVVDATDLVVLE